MHISVTLINVPNTIIVKVPKNTIVPNKRCEHYMRYTKNVKAPVLSGAVFEDGAVLPTILS